MPLFTGSSSVEANPQGDVPVPSPGLNPDIASHDGGSEAVRHYAVPVSVPTVNLKRTESSMRGSPTAPVELIRQNLTLTKRKA